ncbi:11781_t:CDS:1, partial [Ambispora gerdemannii]
TEQQINTVFEENDILGEITTLEHPLNDEMTIDSKVLRANQQFQSSWKRRNTKIRIKRKKTLPKRRIKEIWQQLGECFSSRG